MRAVRCDREDRSGHPRSKMPNPHSTTESRQWEIFPIPLSMELLWPFAPRPDGLQPRTQCAEQPYHHPIVQTRNRPSDVSERLILRVCRQRTSFGFAKRSSRLAMATRPPRRPILCRCPLADLPEAAFASIASGADLVAASMAIAFHSMESSDHAFGFCISRLRRPSSSPALCRRRTHSSRYSSKQNHSNGPRPRPPYIKTSPYLARRKREDSRPR